jgi:hypothetical protein
VSESHHGVVEEEPHCATCAALSHLASTIDRYEGTLRQIAETQQKALKVIESNGFVFDGPLGAEPGNWQHLAFSLYTDICEVDVWARNALGVPLGQIEGEA